MDHGLTVRGGYALFWGQWPSNWHPSPFELDHTRYGCVEQWMMAEKAEMFGDMDALVKIMAATDPADQKRYGRQVSMYVEAEWAVKRYGIVLRGTVEKYRQNPDLRELLMATGDLELVEASPKDRVWGIGLRKEDPRASDPLQWRGANLLGRAITAAREILRSST